MKRYVRSKEDCDEESYGETLVELGAEHEEIVVLDADLAAANKNRFISGCISRTFHQLRYRGK